MEEIIEVAALDTELWVSMTAETMKTFPATGSLNTEISDYEETRPIFTDMVNDLKKLVNKHHDIGMLPLECQYLNKAALVSVVGQQPPAPKHFTLKRNKPKSATLRSELLQKSADAQSSLKKASAPTVPLRSRGMPRKLGDMTPMRGIPSRLPTSGFRSPPPSSVPKQLSRTPAGKKEGGVKLLDITEQPLGYAAAKKRKRQQELEEQQRKALEAQSQAAAATPTTPTSATPSTTTPDYAAGLQASAVYSQPATPMPSTSSANVQPLKEERVTTAQSMVAPSLPNQNSTNHIVVQSNVPVSTPVVTQQIVTASQAAAAANHHHPHHTTVITAAPAAGTIHHHQQQQQQPTLPSNIQIVRTVSYNPQSQLQHTQNNVTSGPPPPSVEIVRKTVPASLAMQQSHATKVSKIISPQSNIILTQKPVQSLQQPSQPLTSYTIVKQPTGTSQMRVIAVSSAPTASNITVPSLTTALPRSTQIIQQTRTPQAPAGTKIVQIKTAPTMPNMMTMSQNSSIPPLISQQPQQILNIQNMQPQQKTVTFTGQPGSNIILRQQQQQQQIPQVAGGQQQQQQPKYAQVVMSPNVKGTKTIILTNPNLLSGQKNVLLRSGNTVYQLGNVQGLQGLQGTTLVTTGTGPPGLIKSEQQVSQQQQQMPALVPTNHQQNIPSLTPVMFASNQQQKSIPTLITNIGAQQNHQQTQQQQQGTTIIRTNVGGVNMVPQGLTLIQRPGQQPQLVQTIQQATQGQPQQIGRTIITTQPAQQQTQTLQIQKIPQVVTQQTNHVQQQQPAQQAPTRRGLSLSVSALEFQLVQLISQFSSFIIRINM